MDIRFCHTSDFSEFLKLENSHTCEFGGFFGGMINSILQPFLHDFNFTAIVERGNGLGQLIDENGNYNGCLGLLQRNASDVLLRFTDYPSPVENITQGDIFLDTRLAMSQTYTIAQADEKFQILSVLKSFWPILPHIIFFFISVIIVFQIADTSGLGKNKFRIYLTFGRPIKLIIYNDRNIFNMFAHAFRFGCLRAKRFYTRPIFLSLSIFSLILIHVFFSSIKTDLVVVTEPEHWNSYEQVMKAKVLPIFISEMETVQYFKFAPSGSLEQCLWEYVITNFNESSAVITANLESFFRAGWLGQLRRTVFITDHIMGVVIQNAVCALNRYQYGNFANSVVGANHAWAQPIYYLVNSDKLSKTILKGVAYNDGFKSRAAKIFKKFVKYSHESGISQKNIDVVTKANMLETFLANLPPSGLNPSSVDDCKSNKIVKPHGNDEKMVTLGNTATLRICHLALNLLALIVLAIEKMIPCEKTKPSRRRRRGNWFNESPSAVCSARPLYPQRITT